MGNSPTGKEKSRKGGRMPGKASIARPLGLSIIHNNGGQARLQTASREPAQGSPSQSLGTLEVRALQFGIPQIGAGEVGAGEVSARQISSAKVGIS